MAGRKHITFCVTPDGEEYMRGFIDHFGFGDGDVVEVSSVPHSEHPQEAPPGANPPQNPPEPQADPQDDPLPPPPPADQAGLAALIPQADGVAECPRCLCKPCVTTPEPLWLGQQPACEENAALRKVKYKTFWATMVNMMPSPWYDDRYLRRKDQKLAEDIALEPAARRLVIAGGGTVREIMPKCVLKLVRGRFPNPRGKAYLGHKWV
ncbi:Hypp5654 [Branchiostoma lanceolatum]|uniref:Hypp5654 protein n=1 Tax=Branchiostoma lanceolatum TaxID=7740 RepID=A0A8J9YQR9_BRALA|nr:Hypp5654 [Branchiostoma lanceolatum]